MPITRDDRLLLHRLTTLGHTPAPRDLNDQTLLSLVDAAQRGDTAAGEQIVAAMAFPLAAMARRSIQTPLADFVTAAWFVIGGFNLQRTSKVMTNLVMDTLKQVTRDRVARWDERIVTHPRPEAWADRGDRREESAHAAALIEAASDLSLIDHQTRAVLQAIYLHGHSGREAAEVTGQTHDMVRYRCSRARRVLRANQRALSQQALW